MSPRIITPEERAARKGTVEGKPIAQFRVKGGCKTCKPVPVYAKPVSNVIASGSQTISTS